MFHYDMRTRWKKINHTVNWAIEKTTDLKIKIVKGPEFEINGDKWHLELSCKHEKSRVVLTLFRSSPDYDVRVKYRISVLDTEDRTTSLTDDAGRLISETSGEVFYHRSKSLDVLKEDINYIDIAQWSANLLADSLEISLHLEFRSLQTTIYDRCVDVDFEQQVVKSLSKGVLDLHDKDDVDVLSDIDLHVQGEVLHAHRFILRARSPVFRKMLSGDREMKDLHIKDLDVRVLEVMLDYMYSKVNFTLQYDLCAYVYQGAHRYQMREMRDLYGNIMFRNLEPINAGKLLLIAELYKDFDLKAAVLNFIRSNHIACLKGDFAIHVGGKTSELYKEVLKYLEVEDF